MTTGNVRFNEIPEIGFIHQFYSLDYGAKYGKNRIKCIEVVYVNSGSIKIKYENEQIIPPTETLIVLADYYEVSIDYILKRTEKPKMNK